MWMNQMTMDIFVLNVEVSRDKNVQLTIVVIINY
jgi:hypothetical protein